MNMASIPSHKHVSPLAYRNAELSIDERVDHLLERMTLAEKAGLMSQDMIRPGPGGSIQQEHDTLFSILPTQELISGKLMSHFNAVGPIPDAREFVESHNRLQEQALATRLGIPITVFSDPRNHFTDNVGTAFKAGVLSQWPQTLGFAALRSLQLVERFADIARHEYLALRLRLALHPKSRPWH
jgi:beta-glucosidase